MTTLSLARARAHWWMRQALSGSKGKLADAIAASGWLRTLGGADVYVAARARSPRMKRSDLDRVVERGELRVVPAARGCIYLVPSGVVADLMAFNADAWTKQAEKDLAKIKKSLKVVESLAAPIEKALAKTALTTDALRKQIEVPSFGPEGKKIGLSSPLPLALRMLELRGAIERTLEGGKLDSTTYLWRKSKPVRASKQPFARIVGAFLAYAGPATVAQIAAWSGVAQRDVKAMLQSLEAEPVTVEGLGEAWVARGDLAAVNAAPEPHGVVTLAFEDNYLINHGGLAAVADPRHHAIKVDIWGGSKPETIGEAAHVLSRTIVVDGLIAGFWEVNPRAHGGVWMTFDRPAKALANQIEEAVDSTARFLLDEVGHAKTTTIDSMDEVQARADRIAKRATA